MPLPSCALIACVSFLSPTGDAYDELPRPEKEPGGSRSSQRARHARLGGARTVYAGPRADRLTLGKTR